MHIIAVAARTPVGLRAESSAAAVRAGISGVMDHPFMPDATGDPVSCGYDRALSDNFQGIERLEALLDAAMTELSDKLSESGTADMDLDFWLSLPSPRPGFGEHKAKQLERRLTAKTWPALGRGGKPNLRMALQGHAGVVLAVERAVCELSSGGADLCVVGGVDSYFDSDALYWLDDDRRLMREDIRGGFPPGEGAALLLLASDKARAALRMPCMATIASFAHAIEQGDEESEEGLLGVALSDVFRRVSGSLGDDTQFEEVFIDINDERARTTDYAMALLRCGMLFRDGSQYTTSVGSTGELGAASAAFNCVLAALAFEQGYARGRNALVVSSSWNGLRGAILLRTGQS